MSAGGSNFSTEHVLGNVSVPRYINPQIRASLRREDPDGNPEPHYTGLNGTTLNIDYSPTGAVALNFTSDNLDDTLALINAADPVNLIALEEDGFLVLKNLNGGEKNYMEIVSGDAAPILGFVISPEPGSKSYAGEVATAPPGRFKGQDNAQGTGLIAGDEDLTSESLNRALARSIVGAARVARDLDILVPAIQEFSGTVVTHAGSGKQVVYVQDASLRIPVNGFDIAGTTPTAKQLDTLVHILSADDEPIIDIDQTTERYARVLDIYSEAAGTGSAALDNSSSVVAFGTPDGKSIFGPTVEDLDIQGVTAINMVRGDLLIANGASFITAGVQPGNTAVIESATNNDPFNHDGEFIVTEVLTEAIIAVRPKSEFEKTFLTTEKPTSLNKNLPGGTNYGTVRVIVGDYFSAKDSVAFEVPSWVPGGAVKLRCVSAARMRDVGLGDFTRALAPNQGSLLKEFKDHIVDAIAGRRHGAGDVDAPAVVGSPDSLSLGTVESQLAELLNHTNNLIAGQVNYGGGIDWADTAGDTPVGPTTNPATDLESQVDKILTDLAGAGVDGVAKIAALAAGDLVGGNLRTQLNQLDTEWVKLNRTETITGLKTFSALAALDGGATVGTTGLTSDGDIEITGATKSFKTNSGADTVAGIITATAPTDHRLLWEFVVQGTQKGRLYASNTGVDGEGIEFTVNASWSGSNWVKDDTGQTSSKMNLSGTLFSIWHRVSGVGSWLDSEWVQGTEFHLDSLGHILPGALTLPGIASVATHVLSLGTNLMATEAEAEVPRIQVYRNTTGIVEKTLVMEFGSSSQGMWRLYASDASEADEAFELTYNAKWNSGTALWNRDSSSRNSANYLFEDSKFRIKHHDSAQPDTWADSSWERTRYEFGIGDGTDSYARLNDVRIIFQNNGSISNPAKTSNISNSACAKNQIKAWANVTLNQAAEPTYQNGFNISSVVTNGSGLSFNIGSDMADDDYAVAVSGAYGTNLGLSWKVYTKQTNLFRVYCYRSDTAALLDLGDSEFGGHVSVMIVGQQ